jgi:hypothetical protein
LLKVVSEPFLFFFIVLGSTTTTPSLDVAMSLLASLPATVALAVITNMLVVSSSPAARPPSQLLGVVFAANTAATAVSLAETPAPHLAAVTAPQFTACRKQGRPTKNLVKLSNNPSYKRQHKWK